MPTVEPVAVKPNLSVRDFLAELDRAKGAVAESDGSRDHFPRSDVMWLVSRLQRAEFERGHLKAENRRLLRRLRKLRHKRR
jgi:hypothetical protein